MVMYPSGTFTLKIQQFSPELYQLYQKTQYKTAALITAYNPHSQLTKNHINELAQQQLGKLLQRYSCCLVYPAQHCDPQGQWPIEPSYCVLGLGTKVAKTLAKQFRQNAIVWVGKDAIPHLHWLKPLRNAV